PDMRATRNLFDGLTVGLLGGSFNPPHDGHRQISLTGLRRMNLDYVWWLVTPGNPQKRGADYASLQDRMLAARACANHPRILISDYESRHGLTYTANTIRSLKSRFPRTRFVWMMGADNLSGFHTWQDWRLIAANVPLAIFNRPGHSTACLRSPAAQTMDQYRQPEGAAQKLARMSAPAWIYFPHIYNELSSTAIRQANQDWKSLLTSR
ncbi:MAG: nicotinate-nucleotide adenylyltransferase, partial [Aquisalinus sp.]|nr:nicotinate-nucleotide adenylyltransferase [Aquisalinus sp.]